jgi:hypothetical protein
MLMQFSDLSQTPVLPTNPMEKEKAHHDMGCFPTEVPWGSLKDGHYSPHLTDDDTEVQKRQQAQRGRLITQRSHS